MACDYDTVVLCILEAGGATMSHFVHKYNESETLSQDELVLNFDIFPPGSDESSVNLGKVIMLQISTWDWTGHKQDTNHITMALILEPADDMGNFRRVGIAEVPNYNGLADDGWEIADVTII